MTDSDVKVRRIRPGERDAALALKCAVWPHLVPANERVRWDWEFDANPAHDPEHPTTLLLERGGELVGLFTLIPHRVQVGDSVGLACDGVDFCVTEACRGLGLSRLLVRRWMSEETCEFAFTTTPSDVAIHVMTDCGGTLLGSVNETVAHAWFADAERGEPPASPVHEVEEVVSFDEEWNRLWERIRAERRLLLVRDAAYLNWRYRDFPFAKPVLLESRDGAGRLTGAAVLQEDRACDRMYVCDLLTERADEPAQRALLRRGVELARAAGLPMLALATRCPDQARVAESEGFHGFRDAYPKFLGRVNARRGEPPVVVTDWYASLGDGDQLYNVGEPKEEPR